MIYVFYTLMGVSALVAILSLIGMGFSIVTLLNTYTDDTEPMGVFKDQWILFNWASVLFCLAAICVQLWTGLPS